MDKSTPPFVDIVKMSFLLAQDKLCCLTVSHDLDLSIGYTSQDFLSESPSFNSLFHPDDSDVSNAIFFHSTETEPVHLTFRIISKNGLVKILSASYTKLFNSEKQETVIELSLLPIYSLDLDVANRSVLSNFIALLENTDDYIYFKDRNHVFTGASQTLVNITDPSEHWRDLIGKTDYDVFPREFADIYYSLEKQVFNGSISVVQEVQPILDDVGNAGWVDNRKYPIKDSQGRIIGLFGIARDITALKQAEADLQKSEFILKEAQQVANMGTWEHNIVSNQLTWFDGIYRILKIDRISVKPSYELFSSFIHPKDREKSNIAYTDSLETLEPYSVDYRICMADGSIKHVNEQGEIFYSNKKAVRAIGTLQDITHEQRPRELASKLTHDYAHLKGTAFFEAISEYIAETMHINYIFIGLSANEGQKINVAGGWALGKPMGVFEYELINTPCEKVLDNKSCVFPQGIQTHFPGDELLVQMGIESYVGVPLVDPQYDSLGVFVALHSAEMHNSDELLHLLELAATRVSSEILREKSIQQLQEIEARFHHVASQSRTFLWEVDPTGLYTYCSEEIELILGYRPEEIVGKKYFYDLHPEEGREEFKAFALNVVKQKQASNNIENQLMTKDGLVVWVNSSGQALSNERGELVAYQGSDTDINDRKLTESRERSRSNVLALMADDAPLSDILSAIVLNVENENPAMRCSILLLDDEGTHLLKGAAPSLPDFYNEAINGLKNGIGVGSCGTSTYTGKRVIVEDIQTHPYWAPYKELAEKAGLGACWSEPIFSSEQKVLGAFAIYHQDIHVPTDSDLLLIEQTAGLASIAIEKNKIDQALDASNKRWQFALEGTGSAAWEYNFQTQVNLVSKQMIDILGIKDEMTGPDFRQLNDWDRRLHPECIEVTMARLAKVAKGESSEYQVEHQVRCENGEYIWLLSRGMLVSKTFDGKPLLMIGTSEDITKRKKSELNLQLAASVFSHAREGIMITDANGTIIEVNETFTRLTGYSREEAIGQNPKILQSRKQSNEFYQAMWKSLLEKGHWYGEVWNRRKSGELYAEMLTISAVKNEKNETKHYVALFTDITVVKEHQEQLEHIAHYDVLTKLPNRVLLADRLSQSVVQCERRDLSLAVVFLDLDGFKAVNDNHGHDIGDELLVVIAQRMQLALREGDTLSRFGGDEFIAVLVDLEQLDDCKPILERLLLAASEPVVINDIELQVSASIGVTVYPEDNADTEQLIRHADQAMYIAKQSGKNRYHLFDTEQDTAVKTLRESIENVRVALEKDQFVLYYQPKVSMKTGEVIGLEALIRWQHPERGLVPPIEFLPVTEEHYLSIEIGEWVIDTALAQLASWKKQGLELPVSVNISARQLQQDKFPQQLAKSLAVHPNVAADQLELEVLETSALGDMVHVSGIMDACCKLGVHFALDDFGTGYSSLTHLRRLPAKMIKIDQTFVRDMLEDQDDLAIIEGVIGLAKAFQREVIAEGVETIEHGKLLTQMGCELAQGYGIAKPMPAEDVPSWVNTWMSSERWCL